jgi:hypothetical protein
MEQNLEETNKEFEETMNLLKLASRVCVSTTMVITKNIIVPSSQTEEEIELHVETEATK